MKELKSQYLNNINDKQEGSGGMWLPRNAEVLLFVY